MNATWTMGWMLAAAVLLAGANGARALHPPPDHRSGPAPQDEVGPDDPPPMDDEMLPGPGPGPRGPRPSGPGDGPEARRRFGDHDEMRLPSKEEIEELLAFAKEHFPEMAEHASELRESDPAMFRRLMRRVLPRLRMMKDVYDRDPQGLGRLVIADHRLNEKIRRAARDYRRAVEGDAKKAAGDQLRALLAEQWDVRMERRRLELADFEKRLAEQKRRLDERAARRDELLQQQFDRLTGEGDLDW